MLKCETAGCDYGSKSKEDLENNIKSNHIELEITTKEPNNSIPDKNNISKKKKKFDCTACGAIRYSIHELKNHISRVHEVDKQFKCEIDNCEYASKSRRDLNRHILSIHEKNKKPFLCTECGMSFIRKGRLENHVGSAHEKKKDFQCELCSAGFACISYLHGHMKKVHKEYAVSEFKYSIPKNHNSNVHEGDKQFKCEIDNCEYASKNRWALKRHSLSIHEKKKKPFDEHGVQKKQLLTVHEGKRQEKKFKCSMCKCAAFTQNHNLIKHIESVHKDRVIWM